MALGIWNRFQSLLFGAAIGRAASEAISPALEPARQEAWSKNLVRVLEPSILAGLVAQGAITLATGQAIAKRNGYAPDTFNGYVQLALHAPGVAEALSLYRRNGIGELGGGITDAQLEHAMSKAGIEQQYHAAIKTLAQLPVDVAEIAKAIHRGNMKDDGLLVSLPPSTPGKVPFYPQSPLDPVEEAAASGTDAERLAILVANAGLPLGLHEMLSLWNRGDMTADDVKRGIANSNLQNQYMDVALNLARRLLTPHDYAELQLRGYISQDARDTGAALSGMTAADAELLYNMLGRSIPVHQITTGEARGGVYKGDTSHIPEAYLSSLERGNLRPEYYSLAYANRYTYPSYFVIKPLVADGALTVEQATQIFENEGWPPELAAAAAQSFAAGSTGTANKHVTSAITSLVTATRKEYIAGAVTKEQAAQALTTAGEPEAAQAQLFKLWDAQAAILNPAPPTVAPPSGG